MSMRNERWRLDNSIVIVIRLGIPDTAFMSTVTQTEATKMGRAGENGNADSGQEISA